MNEQPISVLVCALGGEGGGVLAEWLYSAAVQAGHHAQATSVPGVAQRTGATTYYIEIEAQALAAAGGRRPVFSLNPVPGAIDLLVSSELLETVRQAGAGMVSAERSTVISSTARALTVAEKMQLGDGRSDAVALMATLQRHCRAAELLDLNGLAEQAGCAISAVLFGAIAASGVLPLPRSAYEAAIRAAGKGVDSSLRGFALAFAAVAERRALLAPLAAALAPLPTPADLRLLGRARVAEYQDEAYARLYDERLARIAGASQATLQETARGLALWMAFDDIVRVAELKLAAGRVQRLRREVAARDDEIVKTFEHFKPGVAEIAGLLPQSLAQRLQAWDSRRVAQGREPWALAVKLGSHTVLGAFTLWALVRLKAWRRRGSRYAAEQLLIERWLAAVARGAAEDAALGHELALCGRLIKGYGSTNERGRDKLLHIVDHLATGTAPGGQRAANVKAAREAAVADDSGSAFDLALRAQGAAPRAPTEQVVRWFKRRPGAVG